MLTSLPDSSKGLNIHCTVEVFDHLGQVPLHFFNRAWVDQRTNSSRCNHKLMPIQNSQLPTETSTSDIVARIFGYSLHHFEHSRDDFFQDVRFLAHDLVHDPICQRQDALQSIEKAQRDLVIFVLFSQKLNDQSSSQLLTCQCGKHEPRK